MTAVAVWSHHPSAEELLESRRVRGWKPTPSHIDGGEHVLGFASCAVAAALRGGTHTHEDHEDDVQPGPTRTSNDPMHGQTLEMIVNHLVERLGWTELGERINIRCFQSDPSVKSSLKFLRKTPWARKRVEALFLSLRSPWRNR